jgi:cystathionine beta-synthase
MAAALRYAQRCQASETIVVMCPDTGRNYLSKMYSDDWMIEKGFLKPTGKRHTVGELLSARESADFHAVSPSDSAEHAIQLLRRYGISQLPVVENGKVVGGLRELTLARLLHSGRDPRQVPIRDIMARPFPCVDAGTDLDEVYRLLSSGSSGVVVMRGDRLAGIVTRIDLVEFWDAPFMAVAGT